MTENNLTLLVVTAHPHDITHVAATCGIHVSQGDSVTVVSVGHGVFTHNEQLHEELMKPADQRDSSVIRQSPDQYAKLKIDELRSACAVFGITDVRIIGTTEPFRIYQSPELITKLRDVILEIRPQILITQSPYAQTRHGLQNNSPDDHTEVAHATLEARNLASTPIYGSNIQPHKIAATYFPGVYFEKDQFDFYVDATNWFEKRVEAENAFKSQGHTEEFSRRRIELTLGDTGWFSGTMYAESFVREKAEVVSKITISEHTLKRSKEPPSTHMRRISGLEH